MPPLFIEVNIAIHKNGIKIIRDVSCARLSAAVASLTCRERADLLLGFDLGHPQAVAFLAMHLHVLWYEPLNDHIPLPLKLLILWSTNDISYHTW